jgi:hypothetical protein
VNCTSWFKYDRDKLWLLYTQIVAVIFEPPCTCKQCRTTDSSPADRRLPIAAWECRIALCTALRTARYERHALAFRLSADARNFSLPQNVQTVCETHAAWSWCPFVMNGWSCNSSPPYLFMTYTGIAFAPFSFIIERVSSFTSPFSNIRNCECVWRSTKQFIY